MYLKAIKVLCVSMINQKWSSIFYLDSLTIYRLEGNPSKCKFIKDERLKR